MKNLQNYLVNQVCNEYYWNTKIFNFVLVKQLCEVRYSYTAQNNDELSLKKGDVITLVSKDLPDPGWWKGELNGVVGVFPDNFVALLNSDEKNVLETKEEKKNNADTGV